MAQDEYLIIGINGTSPNSYQGATTLDEAKKIFARFVDEMEDDTFETVYLVRLSDGEAKLFATAGLTYNESLTEGVADIKWLIL